MTYLGEVEKIKETPEGTEMVIKVPGALLADTIERYKQGDKAKLEIRLDDGRTIRAEQRKKYFATLKDIADHTGNILDDLHEYFRFLYRYMHEDKRISMSNCTVSEAKDMISMILDFALAHDVPLTAKGIDRAEDIDRYLYGCIVNKRCCLCGKKADLHHVTGSRIGMGGDRSKTDHVGREVIALCRNHHSQAHQEGEDEFFKLNKVYGIKLDEIAIKKLKL